MIDKQTLDRLYAKTTGSQGEAVFVQRGTLRALLEIGYERLEQDQRRKLFLQRAGRMNLSVKDRMERGTLV